MKKIVFGMGMILLGGCAGATAIPSGFLKNYDALSRGKYLEKVMLAPELKTVQHQMITIAKPSIETVADNSKLTKNAAQEYFSMELVRWLGGVQNWTFKSDSADSPNGSNGLRLETAITELDPGSQAARMWVGPTGLGYSYVQVEGRLVDPASGKVFFAFMDRRSGSDTGGLGLTGGVSRELMQTDLDAIAKSLAKTFRELAKS